MYNQTIILAIQSQQMLSITFRKETDGSIVTREIAPYDIYPMKKKNSYFEEDYLLGYSDVHIPHGAHITSTYLSNIINLQILNTKFSGSDLVSFIKPKKSPLISRNW